MDAGKDPFIFFISKFNCFRGGLASPRTCAISCKYCLDDPWYQEAIDIHKHMDGTLEFFLRDTLGFDSDQE